MSKPEKVTLTRVGNEPTLDEDYFTVVDLDGKTHEVVVVEREFMRDIHNYLLRIDSYFANQVANREANLS